MADEFFLPGEFSSLEKIGPKPKVAFICEETYFKIHFERDLDAIFDIARFPMKFFQPLSFFENVIDYNADYNFFFRGEFLPDGLLDRLSGVKINWSSEPFPKVLNHHLKINTDSFDRLKAFLSISRHPFDYIFHYDQSSASLLRRLGAHISGFVALPVATESLGRQSTLPSVLPTVNAEFDIFFAGRSTPYREKFFSPLKHSLRFFHIESGIFGLELLPLLRKAKIVLNVHASDFISWEPRLQQFLATGCFVISEPISPNPYLTPGEHFIEATGTDAFVERCFDSLSKPELRDAVSSAGAQRVREKLSAKQVFPALLEHIDRGDFKRPIFRIDDTALEALSYKARFEEFDFIDEYFTSFNELLD